MEYKISKSTRNVRRSRKRGDSGLTRVDFPGIGFPDRLGINLRYVDTYNLAGGVPTPNPQVILMNSLYDPDSTGTGHQPQDYDQVTAIYLKYLVEVFEYDIELYNLATAPSKWVVAFSETDISSRTVDQLSETKYCASGTIGRADGGDCKVIVKGSFPLTRLMGQALLDPDSTMYANYNASPSDGAFCIIKVATLDGTSNASVYAKCNFVFHSHFKDRNEPSAS